MIDIFGYQIERDLFLTILGIIVAGIISFFTWIRPRRAKLKKQDEERLWRIEKQAKETNENIKLIQRHFDIPIYVDELPSARPSVFVPFLKGLKLMMQLKWDEAILEFKQALKDAKTSQLVALYNFIGLCYIVYDKLDLALESFNNSLTFASELDSKEGEAVALSMLAITFRNKGELDKSLEYYQNALVVCREINDKKLEAAIIFSLGLIYQMKGVLDKAEKSYEEALKIFRVIGEKEGEAKSLGNLGLIYQANGLLNEAFRSFLSALKINKKLGRKKGIAVQINNIGTVFEAKREKEKALRYFEDALRIFTEIGEQKGIEQTKENIKRLKGE